MRLKAVGAVVLVLAVFSARPSMQTAEPARFVAGEVMVKFGPDANAAARAAAHRDAGGSPSLEIQRTRVQRVRVPAGSEAAAIARYLRNPNVLYAEPNYVRRLPTPVPLADTTTAEAMPGDHYFDEQWALHNTGQSFYCIPWFTGPLCLYAGTADADIDAPEAWALSIGSSAVTVAVIDSGIDYNHPDLAANYVGGDDFVSPDGDPIDDHGHGTHVAGTIAAALDNLTGSPGAAEGVAGVAPNARLRAYKVCRSDGTCDDFAIQQAIARAVADGAKVINMSLGGTEYSQSLDEAVQDAWNAGVVIVAAAGNDGTTTSFYPAALDHVVSVAAFDEDHRRPSFSNYGSWVDISAPGNVIMSTYPMARCSGSSVPGNEGCYTRLTGTSMATPHVSGAAALVWSRSDVTTNGQVVDILLGSADHVGVSSVRLDAWTVNGGLNAYDALTYSSTRPRADAGPDQTVTDVNEDGAETVTLDGSASSDPNGTIVSYEWREGSAPIATGVTPDVLLSVGVHTLTLEVTDNDGESATGIVVVTVNHSKLVTVTASTSQATENGLVPGVFTISRTGNLSAPLTVAYTVSGTAVAGTDYVSLPGSVTIDAGASSATIAVTPIDDPVFESDESVVLTLGASAEYGIAPPGASTVAIVSNDVPPDLVVTSLSVPATGVPGAPITVTDTTRNQGSGTAPASSTGFYLSVNTAFDGSDVFFGSRSAGELGAGVASTASTTLQIPVNTTPGTYYVIARADRADAILETTEINNTKTGSTIRIGGDLVISALSAPATAKANGPLIVTDTTKNQTAASVAGSATGFYLSVDTLFSGADVFLGSRAVGGLGPSGTSSASTTLTVPAGTAPGIYFVIGVADYNGAVTESVESNNARNSSSIRIGPDLVVSILNAPSSAARGTSVNAGDTIRNQGGDTAGASMTKYFLSTNGSVDAQDLLLATRSVPSIGAGLSHSGGVSLPIPASLAAGTYYLIAQSDGNGTVAEATETNNLRSRFISISP